MTCAEFRRLMDAIDHNQKRGSEAYAKETYVEAEMYFNQASRQMDEWDLYIDGHLVCCAEVLA